MPSPTGDSEYVALAEIHAETTNVVGYALFAIQEWTERLRGQVSTRKVPEVLIEWTIQQEGLSFEDGILVDEADDPGHSSLRRGKLLWRGREYQLRWLTPPESQRVMTKYFV